MRWHKKIMIRYVVNNLDPTPRKKKDDDDNSNNNDDDDDDDDKNNNNDNNNNNNNNDRQRSINRNAVLYCMIEIPLST